jgi:hypothetical protein
LTWSWWAKGFVSRKLSGSYWHLKRVPGKEVKMLSKAIADYLEWMISAGYADSTWNKYQRVLDRFQQFVQDEQLVWDDIFTWRPGRHY